MTFNKSNSHAVSLKMYDKAYGGKTKKFHLIGILKSSTTPFKALFKLKYFQRSKSLLNQISFLNKAPFGVVAVFWLGVITIVILIANKLRYDFFVDLVARNFPEAVTVPADSAGKPLYMSVLDRMFAEFEAEINVGYFIFFIVGLRMFLKRIWVNYNPRKRQVLTDKM